MVDIYIMNIIYLITDSIMGSKYLGSKKNWQGPGSYFGSPSIKALGHPKYRIQQQWKSAIIKRPETFMFKILEVVKEEDLQEKELFYQLKHNVVKSKEFINGGYAKKGFEGILKGHKFDEDRIQILKDSGAWNKTDEHKEKLRIKQTGKKYSTYTNKKKGRAGSSSPSARKIKIDNTTYQTINEAAHALGVVRQTIKRRLNNLENYNYVDLQIQGPINTNRKRKFKIRK